MRFKFEKENKNNEKEIALENFCDRFMSSDKITLEDLKELKEKNINTEDFLNYLLRKEDILLHGSTSLIEKGELIPNKDKVFASDEASIAIMKSIYSNRDVNLKYPYFLEEEDLSLKIETKEQDPIIVEKGFVYVVDNIDFENKPSGSWQFVKEGKENLKFNLMIETEQKDFNYPVEID